MRPQHDYRAATRCANCGSIRNAGHLDSIENPSERLFAGEEVPAGQCPECGCCCFLIEETRLATQETNGRKIAFAEAVLNLMESEREWSADTLADIATLATDSNLGHNDDESLFKAGPKPPPSWELLTEWTDGDHPVSWHYRYMGDGKAEHRITYGSQVIKSESDIEAAEEFGYCVRHSLECIGAFSEGPR